MKHRKTELQDFVTTTRWRSQQARAVRVNEKAGIIYVVCLLKKSRAEYLSYRLPHLWRNNAHITHRPATMCITQIRTPRFHTTKHAAMTTEPPSLLTLHYLLGSDKTYTTLHRQSVRNAYTARLHFRIRKI